MTSACAFISDLNVPTVCRLQNTLHLVSDYRLCCIPTIAISTAHSQTQNVGLRLVMSFAAMCMYDHYSVLRYEHVGCRGCVSLAHGRIECVVYTVDGA